MVEGIDILFVVKIVNIGFLITAIGTSYASKAVLIVGYPYVHL